MTATLEHNREDHDAVCRQIEQFRIDDETPSTQPSTMGPKHIRSWLYLGRRRHTYSMIDTDKTIPETPVADPSADRSPYALSYAPLKGSPSDSLQLQRTRKRSAVTQSYGRSCSLDLTRSGRVSDLLRTESEDHTDAGSMKEKDKGVVIMTGWLHKTTQPKNSKTRGHSRQRRRFRLTAHSLEYSHQLQKVKVRKQIPLTSIVDIVYNEKENPVAFKLEVMKSEILLEAHNKRDCELWVKTITKEWRKWPKPLWKTTIVSHSPAGATETSIDLEEQGFFRTGEEVKCINITGEDTSQTEISSVLSNELHRPRYLRRESHDSERRFRPHTSLAQIAIQEKFGLVPRIHSFQSDRLQQKLDEGDDFGALHDLDFVMIKYPRKRKSNSLPHERVFTMDYENLLIMWRQTEYSKFNQSNNLLTEHIVEVREIQNSDGFDRYPFEEAEDRSFSLLVEGEIQAGPTNNTYAVLKSMDLVCDESEEKQLWCRALKSIVSPKRHLSMYSTRFEYTDPTILWLKSHWILLSEGESEIKESIALSFGRSIVPQASASVLKRHVDLAHEYKLSISLHHGSSLHWDSFILFYKLLCGVDDSNCLLLKIYQDYAKDYPTLGMTVEEFRKFLIEQQHWSPDDTTDETCDQLMRRYDYYHRAFKMYMARGNPKKFNIILRLFSFAGFLSFLRSVDNCVIDREHEKVYQDMTQPLNHYFINSSHNTYLEGHQFTGRSTTDAYVRALLQGCRCLELDCWDGPNGEPKITHGHTVVSELSLEEVARTINEYGFRVSDYPIILSLENHCNEIQQARMAEIFQEVFGSKLATRNLVEENNLNRLPSPNELKGKIILKGRKSLDDRRASEDRRKSHERRKSDERSGIVQQLRKKILGQTYNAQSADNDNEIQASQVSDKAECEEEKLEPEQKQLYEDLSKLVVYCQAKRIKPWSWKEQQQTSVCNMFSFVESAALNKCKEHPKELLACTERQFIRTYPSGLRTDSSNYDPHPMWNNGIQMVALNVQTPGPPMFLNQGKFRQNGGCGYILKPKIMRDPGETVYTPNMTKPHPAVTPVNLEITLLSGQNFIIPNKKTSTMEILYQTYGISEDCESLKHMVSSDTTDPLWPQCRGALKLMKTILMPELCLVLFTVNISVHRKFKAGTKQVLLGQNVFPLTSLKPGIHYVPLRKPGGDPVSHIGIFVKIELNQKQASDGLEVPISPHSDTQQTNGVLEDGSDGVENSGWNKSYQTTDTTNSESTLVANGVHCKSQAVIADVHCDNSNNISTDC